MRTITTALITCLLLTTTAGAENLETLAAQAIDAYGRIESTKTEMKEATKALTDERKHVQEALRALDATPLSEAQVVELDTQIERERERLASLEERADYAPAAERTRQHIAQLRMKQKIGRMTDDAERAALRAEHETRRDALQKQIDELEQPFRARMNEVRARVDQHNQALTDAMKRYFLQPGSAPTGTPDQFNFTMSSAFGGLEWTDAEGNKVAWAHVRLRSESEIEEFDRQNLLADTYPIRSLGDGTIWVWAGNFLVTFVGSGEALKTKDSVQVAVTDFVDLAGLAGVNVPDALPVAEASEAAPE